MTRLRTILLLILISLIVTLSIQLTENYSEQPGSTLAQQRSSNIDYSIDNFTLTTMGVDGSTQYHLNAAGMRHYQQSDETLLQFPSVELTNTSGEHWLIQSRDGKVAAKGENILLTGKVEIRRSATSQQKPFIISTESLLIEPDRNLVSTTQSIYLAGDGLQLQSVGMQADLQTETITLLSNVKGSYAP